MPGQSGQFSEEAVLVRRAQGGDRAAFDRLLKAYRGMVLATAYARVRDREEAEDLAQEIFTRAWVKLTTLREPAGFGAWLKTIAMRSALNRATRRPPSAISLDDVAEARAGDEGDPVGRCLTGDRQRTLYAALDALPLENRLAILLHICEGYTCVELAELFGVPLTTIEGRVHRAKAQLRRLLSDEAFQQHRRVLK